MSKNFAPSKFSKIFESKGKMTKPRKIAPKKLAKLIAPNFVLAEMKNVSVRVGAGRSVPLVRYATGFTGNPMQFYPANRRRVEKALSKMEIPKPSQLVVRGVSPRSRAAAIRLALGQLRGLQARARLYVGNTKTQLRTDLLRLSKLLGYDKKKTRKFVGPKRTLKHVLRNRLSFEQVRKGLRLEEYDLVDELRAKAKETGLLSQLRDTARTRAETLGVDVALKVRSVFEPSTRVRTYYINQLDIRAEDVQEVLRLVDVRLRDSKRQGATELAHVYVTLAFKPSGRSTQWSSHKFGHYELKEALSRFTGELMNFIETDVRTKKYDHPIGRIIIRIVHENGGGCNSSGKCGSTRAGDFTLMNPRSTNNNCLFACLPELGLSKFRLSRKACNEERRKHGLRRDSPVPVSIALEMFKARCPGKHLEIHDVTQLKIFKTWAGEEPEELIRLHLHKGHYCRIKDTPRKVCRRCGTKYVKSHTCNPGKISYYQKRVKKDPNGEFRCMSIPKKVKMYTEEDFQKEEKYIVDFDIETHVYRYFNGIKEHRSYAVGFVYRGEYQYFTGADCMIKFWGWLKEKNDEMEQELAKESFEKFNSQILELDNLRKGLLEGNSNLRVVSEMVDYHMLSKLVDCEEIAEKHPGQMAILKRMKNSYDQNSKAVDPKTIGLDESEKGIRVRMLEYSHGGLEGTRLMPANYVGIGVLKSQYRNLLVRKFSKDLDVANCHLTICEEVLKRQGLRSPILSKFNQKRERMLKKVWKFYGLDEKVMKSKKKLRAVPKTLFIMIGYGGDPHKLSQKWYDSVFGKDGDKNEKAEKIFKQNFAEKGLHPFVEKFHTEMRANLQVLVERNEDVKEETRLKNMSKKTRKDGDLRGCSAFLIVKNQGKILIFNENNQLSLLGGKGNLADGFDRRKTLMREVREEHAGALRKRELVQIQKLVEQAKPIFHADGTAYFVIEGNFKARGDLCWKRVQDLETGNLSWKLINALKCMESPLHVNPRRGENFTSRSKTSGEGLVNSTISTILTRHENEILNSLIEHLTKKHILVTCLMSDGLHAVVDEENVCEILKGAEKQIFKDTGFKVRLTEKAMWLKKDSDWAKKTLAKGSKQVIPEFNRKPKKCQTKLYVNAYNGSGFDFFKLKEAMVECGDVEDEIWASGGSQINKLRYKRIQTFDLNRHMVGSLRDNLKEWGCKVLKGDFDHKRSTGGWEKMDRNARRDCLKYLKKDVMGLRELRKKKNESCIKLHGVSMYSSLSASAFSWKCWKREGMLSADENGLVNRAKSHVVQLPNIEIDKFFRMAIKGGRTYLNKKRFVSDQREGYLRGEITFDELVDYMIDADAVSLYPAAMLEEYPVGYCERLEKGDKKMQGKMGVYKCNVQSNKFLAHPISGRRKENGGLSWDLQDQKEVWLTSIEIEDMVKNGYKIEILDGYFWKDTAPVFKKYIRKLFKEKKRAKKGTGAYMTAKINMNGLFGKNIQNPIFDELKNFAENHEYWEIFSDYEISSLEEICDSKGNFIHFTAKCRSRDPQKVLQKITKPSQYGAFILSYSRRIMLGFMKQANKHFDSYKSRGTVKRQIRNDYASGDTDSLQMHARLVKKISKYAEEASKLGLLSDDLKGGKILRGIWIAPKLYALEYVKRGSTKLHYHLRGKGLDRKKMKWADFEAMLEGSSLSNTRSFSIRSLAHKVPSTASCLNRFSLRHYEGGEDKKALTRIVNKKPWSGRAFSKCGNLSLPWGYEGLTKRSALSFLSKVVETLKDGEVVKKTDFYNLTYKFYLKKWSNTLIGQIFADAIWSLFKHEPEAIEEVRKSGELFNPDKLRRPHRQSLVDISELEADRVAKKKREEKRLAREARRRQRAKIEGVRARKKKAKSFSYSNSIYHWNVNGGGSDHTAKQAKKRVEKILRQEKPLLFGIAEPKSTLQKWFKLEGYNRLKTGKTIVYAAESLKLRVISKGLIRASNSDFKFLYAYRSPNKGCGIIRKIKKQCDGHIFFGDLNAHSTRWGNKSDRAGDLLNGITTHKRLKPVKERPTYKKYVKNTVQCSTIDLAFAPNDENRWEVEILDSKSLSDHNLLKMQLVTNEESDYDDFV